MTIQIDDMTPVIIGAGQFQMDVPGSFEGALGPVDMAAKAIQAAFEDTGAEDISRQVDRLTSIRIFADNGPVFPCPFGTSTNMPLSIAGKAGLNPKSLIYSKLGGEQPQVQIAKTAQALAKGAASLAVVCGGEAIATMKAAMRAGAKLDWSDDPETSEGVEIVDHGFDMADLPISYEELRHGFRNPIMMYAMMETARRLRLRLSVRDYQKKIGELFSPFSRAAAENPYAMFKQIKTAEEISTPSPSNSLFSSPYTKSMVAKDGVNQGAAIIMTTVGKAKSLGVTKEKWVFLNGYASGEEPLVSERPNIDAFPVLEQVIHKALISASIKESDITIADFYSCFPIVVFSATELLPKLSISQHTLTGGLPFFGGPGNNYSMHAIAEMVSRLRGCKNYGLIHANGGIMTKHAVGIYSTEPKNFKIVSENEKVELRELEKAPNGIGTLISYCLSYKKNQPSHAVVLVLTEQNNHALAKFEGDLDILETLELGQPLKLSTGKAFNSASLS